MQRSQGRKFHTKTAKDQNFEQYLSNKLELF